jgi:hypothetical protein
MRVHAVHDVARACITIYVEVDEVPDGTRGYLTTGPDGDEVVQVAPLADAPAYARLPRHLAVQLADALEASPIIDAGVTLDTWRDFVTLIEEAAASWPRPLVSRPSDG